MKIIIPEAAIEQHIAVLGKTGSGKTYVTKAVIAEPLLERGRTVGVIDPTGVWWGVRSSADGKGDGFKVLVLGGDHGDLPLPALGGAAVARLLAEQRVSLIADTSQLTVGERTRWMTDFAGALYRANRQPLYLILDEAHVFAPQGKVPDPDTGKMLHAVNTLASGGRARGVRMTMITQRPAKLHKDTLTCTDTLIALRVLAPQDRQAVKDWIDGCGDVEKGREVLDSLAQLQRGEGWVWYPEGGHLVRAKFPRIRTFDSSATPQHGEALEQPKRAAEVDLTEIRAALADAVREAEENDPKRLRARIAELERRPAERVLAVDHDAVRAAEQRGYERGLNAGARDAHLAEHRMRAAGAMVAEAEGNLARASAELGNALAAIVDRVPPAPSAPPESPQRRAAVPLPPRAGETGAALPRAERLILTALAQYPQGRTKVQVAILTGYSVNGGGFANALGSLRSAGRIEGGSERLTITQAGLQALGPFQPLPRGRALLDHWLGQLGKAERKALEALAEAYPRTLSKAQIAARAGYEADGGGFANAMSRLRTLELIKGRGEMKASDDLFGE